MERINKLAKMDEEEVEDFIERAAIMEYDGGLLREEAEREAYKIIERKRNEDNT